MKCKTTAFSALLIFIFSCSAVYAGFVWSSAITFALTGYNTTVGFSETAYFDNFTFSSSNTSITFENVYFASSDAPITNLTVSSQNANLTFTVLNYHNQTAFALNIQPSTIATVKLSPFALPVIVTVNGVIMPVGSDWTYNPLTSMITFGIPYTGGSDIVTFGYAVTPPPLPPVTSQNITYHFPTGLTVAIPKNMKVHFGNEWFSTANTNAYLSCWVPSGWVNYTVDSVSTQQVYFSGYVPILVLIDGIASTSYSYSNGTTTISTATTSVAIYYFELLAPPNGNLQVYASYMAEYVAVNVTVAGPITVTGTTTLDPYIPLTFYALPAGNYTVSGIYLGIYNETLVTVYDNATSQAILNFGGSPVIPPPTSGTQVFFRDNIITTNNVTGFQIQWTSGTVNTTASENFGVTSELIQFGFTAYMVTSKGASTSLLGEEPTALITRPTVGEGMQTSLVTVGDTRMVLGYDSITVRLYMRLLGSSWIPAAQYTTERLMYKGIVGGTWQFQLYTKVALNGLGESVATAYWGGQNCKSGIAGWQFVNPLPQEVALFKAGQGDFVGAVLYPFMLILGDLFYGFGLLFVSGVLYLRHKKWEVILVCLLLFGGAGGLGLLIPDAAYRLVYVVVAFVIAFVLYRVFR